MFALQLISITAAAAPVRFKNLSTPKRFTLFARYNQTQEISSSRFQGPFLNSDLSISNSTTLAFHFFHFLIFVVDVVSRWNSEFP